MEQVEEMTYTYAILEVPRRIYQWIWSQMEQRGAVEGQQGDPLDMHGIALAPIGGMPTLEQLQAEAIPAAHVLVENVLPEGTGFVLLTFAVGDGEREGAFISNTSGPGLVEALRRAADQVEASGRG